MLTKNAQFLIFSTLLAGGAGQSLASPVLYAWAGNTAESAGGRTYVIDPVAGTVIMVRGAGQGSGGGSGHGASAGASGGGGSGTGGNSSGGGMGAGGWGGGSSPGARFSASSRALTFAGPPAAEESKANDCGPDQRISAIERSAAKNAKVDVLDMLSPCSETPPTEGLPPVTRGPQTPDPKGPQPGGPDNFPPELTPSEAPSFVSPSQLTDAGTQSTIAAVPEPTSLALLGSALAVFGAMVRRRKR